MEILHKTRKLGDRLGAGLITGAADDDPSGIATYSQGGAQFGGGLLWTLVLTTPLMIGIQMVSARLGWITGKGLAANIQQVMPRWVGIVLVALLVFANTLNIAADIAAMGEALQLIVGGGEHGHALVFGVICAVLPLWLNFDAMVRVLKWLTLALFAYVAVALMMQVDWHTVGVESVSALRTGGGDYWMMVVAVLGTTISPYLFFWQAAQEAEMRQRNADSEEVVNSPLFTREHLFRIKLDTVIGMGFSNVIAFCIMLAAAMAFHQHGITDIQTSRQAALALEPIAGHFAFLLFALGVIGTGMLAGAGAGRFCSLCRGGGAELEGRTGPSLHRGQRLLFGAGGCHRDRHADGFHQPRSDQGAGVECGGQRRDRGAHHGGDDAAGIEPCGAGRCRVDATSPLAGLGGGGGDGGGCCGHGARVSAVV